MLFRSSVQPNATRIKGRFLPNVLFKAGPGGLTDVLLILGVEFFAFVFRFELPELYSVAPVVMLTVGIVFLYMISRPVDRYRLTIWALVAVASLIMVLVVPYSPLRDWVYMEPMTTRTVSRRSCRSSSRRTRSGTRKRRKNRGSARPARKVRHDAMTFYMPTRVYEEENCVAAHAAELAALGTKAMLVTGRRSAKVNGSQADVAAALDAQDIPYLVFDEIEENPSIETVMKARDVAVREGADFFIGIGGGSQ